MLRAGCFRPKCSCRDGREPGNRDICLKPEIAEQLYLHRNPVTIGRDCFGRAACSAARDRISLCETAPEPEHEVPPPRVNPSPDPAERVSCDRKWEER